MDSQSPSDYARRVGGQVFLRYTPARGSDEAFLAWYDTHKATLTYNPRTKTFKPKP